MRLSVTGALLSSTEAGKTETSEPVSTRKEHPDNPSITDSREPTLESMEKIARCRCLDDVTQGAGIWTVSVPAIKGTVAM